MALNNYFEIISKEQWQRGEPYRQTFQKTFKKKEYQKVAPKLFDLFRKMNGGKIKKTLVFDFETKRKATLNKNDLNLIQALLEVGYQVDKISYHSGKALKDNKEVNIIDILNSLESKIKTKDKMKEVYEKTQNPAIQKQLKFLDDLEQFGLITGTKINLRKLSIFNDKQQKIVFTYDHRAIASQSTEVGWHSCMNLDSGMYREMVGSGVAAGLFIAYLVKKGDEYTLDKPTARVLFKPYENKQKQILWEADIIYGTAPESFRDQAKKIVDQYQEATGKFELKKGVYKDEIPRRITRFSPEQEKELKKFWNNPDYINKLPEELQLYLIEEMPDAFEYMANP
jgi:hypothetical protein